MAEEKVILSSPKLKSKLPLGKNLKYIYPEIFTKGFFFARSERFFGI